MPYFAETLPAYKSAFFEESALNVCNVLQRGEVPFASKERSISNKARILRHWEENFKVKLQYQNKVGEVHYMDPEGDVTDCESRDRISDFFEYRHLPRIFSLSNINVLIYR